MKQSEVCVDVMAQSESTQVIEPLEEAPELTSIKNEILQTVKQHEITKKQLRSRASSRSSVRSHLSTVCEAESRKENRTNDNQHNQKGPLGHTFDAAQNQEKSDDQSNNFVNSTNSAHYRLRIRKLPRAVSSNEDKRNNDQKQAEPDEGHNKIDSEFLIFFSFRDQAILIYQKKIQYLLSQGIR